MIEIITRKPPVRKGARPFGNFGDSESSPEHGLRFARVEKQRWFF